jgi:hypothetical protein
MQSNQKLVVNRSGDARHIVPEIWAGLGMLALVVAVSLSAANGGEVEIYLITSPASQAQSVTDLHKKTICLGSAEQHHAKRVLEQARVKGYRPVDCTKETELHQLLPKLGARDGFDAFFKVESTPVTALNRYIDDNTVRIAGYPDDLLGKLQQLGYVKRVLTDRDYPALKGKVPVSVASIKRPTVSLGVAAPLTGPLASSGAALVAGVQLAIEERNAKGGIVGQRVEILIGHDAGRRDDAAVVAARFAKEQVIGVVGHPSREAAVAASMVYGRMKIVYFAVGYAPGGEQTGFAVSPAPVDVAQRSASYATQRLKAKRLAVLFSPTPEGNRLANEFSVAIQREQG